MRPPVERQVLVAVLVAVLLRWLPHYLWGFGASVRDETLYLRLAQGIVEGEGLGSNRGWLWAPGYPYFIAALQAALPWSPKETLPWVQGLVGGGTVLPMYLLGRRLFGPDVGRVAAWIYALHPALVFYSGRAWSEAIYGPMLISAVLAMLWAREGHGSRGLLPGVLLGGCVLLRGVAQLLPPFFLLAMLWPEPPAAPSAPGGALARFREAARARWRGAAALGMACALAVAPYSLHASVKHGGLIVSDATVGNLMYLGNNDFPPLTFDYGNGVFKAPARQRHLDAGRPACTDRNPVRWNRCEVRGGLQWIRSNPDAFVARIPLRVAQLLNPHSFLTRALRWGKFEGLPWWLKEGLIAGGAALTFAIVVGGTAGALARGRGPYAVVAWGAVLTTVAASGALYGLTRFRLPLEPLWILFLAALICQPRAALRELGRSRLRALAAVALLPVVTGLVLWFAPAGWPGWRW